MSALNFLKKPLQLINREIFGHFYLDIRFFTTLTEHSNRINFLTGAIRTYLILPHPRCQTQDMKRVPTFSNGVSKYIETNSTRLLLWLFHDSGG